MVFFLILGIIILFGGFVYLSIALLSKNPKYLVSVTGELIEKRGYKNYATGRLGKIIIPHATEYTYAYIFNGKTYKLKGVVYRHPRTMFNKTTIVFFRWFPWYSFEKEFSSSHPWSLAIMYLLCGILCIGLAFLIA